MQTLLLIAALGLVQEPPLQIPPPPTEAPVQIPAPAPPAAPTITPARPVQAPVPVSAPAAPASASPLSFFSESLPFSWDRTIPLAVNLDGLKVTSIFFNKRVVQILKGAEFGTRAQVEVINTSQHPKVPGFAVAILDKEGRLLGVASGGTKFGTVKPGESETFDLNFSQVKERLPLGDRFLLAIELRD